MAPENNSTLLAAPAAATQFLAGGGGPLGVAVGSGLGVADGVNGYLQSLWALDPLARDAPLLSSVCVMNPRSRAVVTLNSTDPLLPPRVELNFLEHPEEVAESVHCLNTLADISARLADSIGLQPLPAPTEEYVRSTCANGLHFVGGCRVGEVVDGAFRVRGVQGLRVVDGSVIPDMPRSAGPMASVYMLSEFAAAALISEARL